MTCPKCKFEGTIEIPHPIHGAAIRCQRCNAFLKWKGKDVSPTEFYAKKRKLGEEKKFKPGFAYACFVEKFGRPPTAEEQMG